MLISVFEMCIAIQFVDEDQPLQRQPFPPKAIPQNPQSLADNRAQDARKHYSVLYSC